MTPREPGYSVEMKRDSMDKYSFPGGEDGWWRSQEAEGIIANGRRGERDLSR